MEIFDIIKEREDQIILNRLFKVIKTNNIKSICDYGCGNGRILKKLKEKYPQEIKYTGIDSWANNNKSNNGNKDNEKPIDEENLIFLDNSTKEIENFIQENNFDLVFSSFALHHFRYPIKELKRLEELLNTNGVLIIVDMHRVYTDENQIAENLIFFNSQMMMAYKGDYHHIPYTKEETADLLHAINVTVLDQEVTSIELIDKEKKDFQKAFNNWIKEAAKKAEEEDEKENRHPLLKEIFHTVRQLNIKMIEKEGAIIEDIIITTAKKNEGK